MRLKYKKLASIIVLIGITIIVLNIDVTTRKGVDYQWYTIKLPLYLKIIDFFDRHYNYQDLIKTIVKDAKTDDERAIRVLEWTHINLRRVPAGLAIIDDHVWYTIVRGYGACDQFQDVFATLCNYTKLEAFFCWVYQRDNKEKIPLSFVKLKNKWSVFDAYKGVYFKNTKGEIADIQDLIRGKWEIVTITQTNPLHYQGYSEYFKNLDSINYDHWMYSRSAIQSPVRRLISWIKVKK